MKSLSRGSRFSQQLLVGIQSEETHRRLSSDRWWLLSDALLRSPLISISFLRASLEWCKNIWFLLKSIIIDLSHWLMNWRQLKARQANRRQRMKAKAIANTLFQHFYHRFWYSVALVSAVILIRVCAQQNSSKQKFNLKLWTIEHKQRKDFLHISFQFFPFVLFVSDLFVISPKLYGI